MMYDGMVVQSRGFEVKVAIDQVPSCGMKEKGGEKGERQEI